MVGGEGAGDTPRKTAVTPEQMLPSEPGGVLEPRAGPIAGSRGAGRHASTHTRTRAQSPLFIILTFPSERRALLTPGCLYKALDSFPRHTLFKREENASGWRSALRTPCSLHRDQHHPGQGFSMRQTNPRHHKEQRG